MWSIFKKQKPTLPPRPTVPVLPHDDIQASIVVVGGQGVRLAMRYATMMGFEHQVLNTPEATTEFLALAQREPAFTEEGIQRAVERLIDDLDVMCSDGVAETFVYGADGTLNQHLRRLAAFMTAVEVHGAKQVFAAADFDVEAFLQRITVERRNDDLEAIFAKLDEKRPFLAPLLMRAKARGRNKYGDLDYTELFDELVSFLRTYFDEEGLGFFYNHLPLMLCYSYVEPWLTETQSSLDMPVDGVDFEHWCAAQIEEQGWQVRVSKASGDQGIDIEAMKDGMLVGIQCKRYTKPIGNKSVQEAYTGATHYRANKAVVIGTGGYTKAAVELAENTGVILIDAENISAFTSLVRGEQ